MRNLRFRHLLLTLEAGVSSSNVIKLPHTRLFTFLMSFLVLAATAQAGIITIPPGLNVGDQYRLVFVTSIGNDSNGMVNQSVATGVIGGLNNLIASSGLSSLGTTWTYIASQTGENVRTKTGTDMTANGVGVGFYNLAGVKVANNNSDFWDGSHAAAINVNEQGNLVSASVWTGMLVNGDTWPGSGVIGLTLLGGGNGQTVFGSSGFSDNRWAFSSQNVERNFFGGPWIVAPYYVTSGILTVRDVTAVPEPSSLTMASIVLAMLGAVWSYKQFTRTTAA